MQADTGEDEQQTAPSIKIKMIRYYKKFYLIKVYENWFQYRYRLSDFLGLNVYWHVKKTGQDKYPRYKIYFPTRLSWILTRIVIVSILIFQNK